MTSWKESDPEPVKPKKSRKTAVSPAAASKAGWQAKVERKPRTGQTSSGRGWLDEEPTSQQISRSSIRKWSLVGGLLAALLLLTSFLIQQLFFKQPKLPLYTVSVGDYPSVAELRENPFGNLQRGRVFEINANYVMPHPWELNGNDNALSHFQFDNWEQSLTKPVAMTRLGNSISAFYFSCFARVSPDSIELYHQASRPFDAEDRQVVDLQDLLENVARSVSQQRDHFAWILLDLHLPNSATNLGWGRTPWRTAVEATLARVPQELVDRLIITLPADDGQNNWLAPEYSASFFGHHVFRLLDGPNEKMGLWDRIRGRALTLDEFRSSLTRVVANDVANRRYAVQRPVWLPNDVLDRVKSLGLVGGSRGNFSGRATTDSESRLRQVRELWRRLNFEDYRDGFRWDPLGYAKLESQLIAMEQIALTQPDSFEAARDAVVQEFSKLLRPASEYQVSLVEDSLRLEYFYPESQARRRWSKDKLDSLLGDYPNPFSPTAPGNGSPETLQEHLSSLSDREKYHLVWRYFRDGAGGDRSLWDTTFRAERLNEAFNFLANDAGSASDWPIEIYWLARLKDDCDWTSSGEGRMRAEACAKLIRAFDLLQRITSRPEPELSNWLRKNVAPIEPKVLLGFDWLVAGHLSAAIERLDSATADLQTLEKDVQRLASALEAAQEVFRTTPHLLGWLFKEHQFSETPEEIENQIAELGRTAGLSWKFLQRLSIQELDISQIPAEEMALPQLHSQTLRSFDTYVDEKTDANPAAAARGASLTFRRNQIALMTPFLSASQRERLHTNVIEFLENSANTDFGAAEHSIAEERSSEKPVSIFVSAVRKTAGDTAWNHLLSVELPYELSNFLHSDSLPDWDNLEQAVQSLWIAELNSRAAASFLGMVPSLYSAASSSEMWPFAAATGRWSLMESQRLAWQAQRLAVAGWGHGAIVGQNQWSDFMFGRLAGRYLSHMPNAVLPELAGFQSDSIGQSRLALEQRAAELTAIELQFGEDQQSIGNREEVSAPISVRSQPWKAIASVFMGSRGSPLPWNASEPADRIWATSLEPDGNSNQIYKVFSTEYWQSGSPTGWLVVRGNWIRKPIDWRRADAQYVELTFQRSETDGAMIRAESSGQPPILNVVILMDCSDSMDLNVPALIEGAAPSEEVRLLDQVKQNLNRVLSELSTAHQHREADIRVSMIPFGVAHYSQLEPVLQGMLSDRRVTVEPSDPGDWGHFYPTKNFRALDDSWLRDLNRLVLNLRSQADTPLYDAIREAVGQVKAQRRNPGVPLSTHILVFSDGVHFVNRNSPYRDRSNPQQPNRSTPQEVKSDIESINARLSILHYDHFESWVLSQPQRNRSEWRRVQDEGISELTELARASPLIDYVNSTDASLMVRKALEAIPRTGVSVVSQSSDGSEPLPVESTRTGYRVHVPAVLLPGTFEVTSSGSRGGAQKQVELVGGEAIELLLDSGSSREFSFPEFEPDNVRSGWIGVGERQATGGGFSSNVWYKPASYSPLSFIWMFRNQDSQRFTSRPAFIVGMITPPGESQEAPYILADHDFEPNTHYPRLRFSDVPWNQASAEIRIWLSDSMPMDIGTISIHPDEKGEQILGSGQVQWKRSGHQVQLEVQNKSRSSGERLIILFPQARQTSRRFFVDSGDEIHEASYSDEVRNEILELQWITLDQLSNWARIGQITEIVLDGVPTQRR